MRCHRSWDWKNKAADVDLYGIGPEVYGHNTTTNGGSGYITQWSVVSLPTHSSRPLDDYVA
jgi:hypothetical protein